MKRPRKLSYIGLAVMICSAASLSAAVEVEGELQTWHCITLTFDGPETSEQAAVNPFRDYRLQVTFQQGEKSYTVPGYYAADGRAAHSSADTGNKWRVKFAPDQPGEWTYSASFRTGSDIAVNPDATAGQAVSFDGAKGTFRIQPTNKVRPDMRARGRLEYVGQHYLQFSGSKEYYLKGGADSPENFLAYDEFDHTPGGRPVQTSGEGEARRSAPHRYTPHRNDWRVGDPTWAEDKGKNILGALNYLASKGMNSVYFLTMNVGGDGDDVWPWTSREERMRFDCSKLDQWEIVFAHMDRLGLLLHIVTQETENDQLLDRGELGLQRRLYYRELVARFGHHLAVVWNLGEENTNTDQQRQQFCRYLRSLDVYRHPLVVHTYPDKYDEVYKPLLGFASFEGPSLQMGKAEQTHRETLKWREWSARAGRPWFVCLDEIGPADTGVKPDSDDPEHQAVRRDALWGNLMAGGAGCEWYFGYKFAHNDLNCEDWRSRERLWEQTRHALDFFQQHLPFSQMTPKDDLVVDQRGYCFAKGSEIYAIYLPDGGEASVDLEAGNYSVSWFDPRQGGPLQDGRVKQVAGSASTPLGPPPREPKSDWVILLRKEIEK